MFQRFKHRCHDLERLDTGDYTPAEYRRWHREMWYIYRLFGELRALKKHLLPEIDGIPAAKISVLDIGAGSGELLRCVGDLSKKDIFLAGMEIDRDAVREIRNKGLSAVRGDAFHLPFCDDAFDLVYCTLFLHHFNNDAAVAILREMARVARRRIIVIDLHRDPIPYYFYRIAGWPLLQRFTYEDGSLSIRRSFRPEEFRDLARKAGLSEIAVHRSAAYRLVLSGK